MSLFSTLTVSLSGLQAASTQLQLTANNIANAGQEGYTRKTAVTTTANLGEIGGGTQITGFTRAENNVLFKTLTGASSEASLRSTQDDYLQQVQDILGTSSSDSPQLSQTMTAFANAWTQMASEPESLVAQRQVVQTGTNLAQELQRISSDIQDLDRQCKNDIDSTLNDLNGYLIQVRDLNQKISQAVNANQSAGDLEDARDKLVLKISEITGVTVLQRNYGQIALYTSTGYQLVDGASARSFTYDGSDVASSANPGLSLNTALSGGRIQALIDMRTVSTPVSTSPSVNVIQKLRSQIDAIATALTDTVTTATSGETTFAAAYNNATGSAGELAANFFVGSDSTTIAVNSALLDGTQKVKMTSAAVVSDSLLDSTRTFTSDGLNVSSSSYTSLVTSVLTNFQQAANNVATLKSTAESRQSYLQQKLTNETNVNVDTEMVRLITLQQTYSASARTMSVVREMFQMLESLLV